MIPTIKMRLEDDAVLPQYETNGSSGMDLRANLTAAVTIKPGEVKLVSTGLFMEIPPLCEGQIRSRSGLTLKTGLIVANAPGTIDSDYRGEVKIIMANIGKKPARIAPGDRIAQIIFAHVFQAVVQEVHVELSDTERGEGGFGSTGVS